MSAEDALANTGKSNREELEKNMPGTLSDRYGVGVYMAVAVSDCGYECALSVPCITVQRLVFHV